MCRRVTIANLVPAIYSPLVTSKEISMIRTALLQAYAHSLLIDIPKTLRGNELFPLVCNVLADYFVIGLCQAGEIPYTYTESFNQAKNCHHAKFTHKNNGRVQFTISKTDNPGMCPRKSVFRTKYAANNRQQTLWVDEEIIDETAYLIYTHGGTWGDCSFLSVGFPQSNTHGWVSNPWIFYHKPDKETNQPVAEPDNNVHKKPKLKEDLTQYVIERL